MNTPRIAIVYDRINTFGGAEQVLLSLRDIFPQSVLYTSVYDRRKAKWLGDWKVYTSFLQSVPFAKNHHQWFGWLMPFVFESLDLSRFDLIISVTSEAAKGVHSNPNQLHICYCLTPTRYLWSHTHEYEGKHLRWLKRLFFSSLREWDYIAAQRPDVIIPISRLVKNRIEKFYGRRCENVIYPPVEIESISTENRHLKKEAEYFLVVSRLVQYKRIDLAITACKRLKKRLVIVGTGTDESRLRSLIGSDTQISLRGFVDQNELEKIYAGATALICPQEEDFGIVGVEAQARGVPVVTYVHSGVTETISPDTGITFQQQTVDSLQEALRTAEGKNWDRRKIQDSVQSFSSKRFRTEFFESVQTALEKQR